jgi:NADH-quinone oxidoreductase subunit H
MMSALIVVLFLGGWWPIFNLGIFWLIPGFFWFFLKLILILFFFIWVRATLPRYRYDQLMALGWKVILPLSLGFLFLNLSFILLFIELL